MQLLAHLGACLSGTCGMTGFLYKCDLTSRKLEQLVAKPSACIMQAVSHWPMKVTGLILKSVLGGTMPGIYIHGGMTHWKP